MDLRLIVGTGYVALTFDGGLPWTLDKFFRNSIPIPIEPTVNVVLTNSRGGQLAFAITQSGGTITGIVPPISNVIVTPTTVQVPDAFTEVLFPLCAGANCILQFPFSPSQFRQ